MIKESSGSTDGYDSDEARISEIKQSMLFSGELHMRNLFSDPIDASNTMMFRDSYWSKRFAVIKSGLLLLYKTLDDVYDEDKDPVSEISLENILVVESSSDDMSDPDSNPMHSQEGSECSETSRHKNSSIDCLFDVHARVQFGGDSQGIRVFSFYSESHLDCADWMRNLCMAVGFLQLVPASGGGYVSIVSEAALMVRKEQQLKRQVSMMRKGSGGPAGDLRRLSSLSNASHEDERGCSPAGMGRGRGRGRGFRGLSQSSQSQDSSSREVDVESVFREQKRAGDDDGKKGKEIENAHRNHFRKLSLTGGGGRGFGRTNLRGSFTKKVGENGEVLDTSERSTDHSDGPSMLSEGGEEGGYEEDKEDPHKYLEDHTDHSQEHSEYSSHIKAIGISPDRNIAIHLLMKDRPSSVLPGRGRGAGRGRGRGRGFETSPN